jgi:hypothetical protein
MKASIILCIAAIFALSTAAFAEPAQGGKDHAPGPCQQIEKACKDAGFILGDAKKGDGLWVDCIDPIIQGKTTVPGATKPLPKVDASLVAACKAKNPKFGEGKVGTK